MSTQLADGTVNAQAAQPQHGVWDARLVLAFERRRSRTTMTRRVHEGPLVVQKPLYPEGADLCQCLIVHPPAGIAGGDRLSLDVSVGGGANVQLTTPGAAKWYRTSGLHASQALHARVASGALLEWLPQGTIVYDGALARSTARIELAGRAIFIGAEVVALGRTASGERFCCGEWRQCFEIVRDGALIWSERMRLEAMSPLLRSPVGLNGAPVFGTFVGVSARVDDAWMPGLRAIAPAQGEAAVTRLPDLVVARYRGHSMEAATAYFVALWTLLRPAIAGREAVRPRIFAT